VIESVLPPAATKAPAAPGERRLAGRFVRFGVGSAAATMVSAVAFALAYRVGEVGPRWASVIAFGAGFVVNFTAGRGWAWAGRSRRGQRRLLTGQLAGYLAIAVLAALLAIEVSSVADTWSLRLGLSTNQRTVLVETAYFASYAVTFLMKFLLLDRWVFRPRPS
jgi:putative flippase GtrA